MFFLNKKDRAKKYISNLVDKMLNKSNPPPRKMGGGLSATFSSDSICWKALREAEGLKVSNILKPQKNC